MLTFTAKSPNRTLQTLVFLLSLLVIVPAAAIASDHRQFEFDRIELDTGVTLEYVERGRDDRPAVIFIHGWLDSMYSWEEVLRQFPAGYRLIAVTMRGHGLSDKPLNGYQMSNYAEDLLAFMDQLQIAKAHLVGHSMGTTIIQQFATENPDRVGRIVMFGGVADAAGNEVLQSILPLVEELNDPVDQDLVREFVESLFIRPGTPIFVDRLVREELLVTARTWQLGLQGLLDFDSRPVLHLIEARTLVVYGTDDQLFSMDDQLDLVNGIPNARLLLWEGVGHAMHWEDPARAVSTIHKFLRRDPARGR
jgi:non-heme chloroperoxidase